MAVTVSGLTACRTSPNVAAYVGDEQISVGQLRSAVDERLADPDIAAYAKGAEDDYTRRVLSLLVQEKVYAVAVQRNDVEVSDDDVRARIDELVGEGDPDDAYAQAAQAGFGRDDVFESIRQQLARQRLAQASGQADALDESALRARYEEVRESLGKISFGYIAVTDQATAEAVLAQLTSAPGSYRALAAQYAGAATLPALEERAPDELPQLLAEGIQAAAPNTGFITTVPDAGVVVTFVAGTVYPAFEDVRADLEQEAAGQIDSAANDMLVEVRDDLGVTVNPRYGVLEDGRLVAGDGGVVDFLGDDGPDAAPAG
jgi:peptidyl-prolyl cis-trans isomerase SurA